jgi:hypothetical protein
MIVTALCVFSQGSLYVHLIVIESNNGESLLRERKRHNAKLCPFAIRQRIVNALANGDSVRAIARGFRVSNNTVVAIRNQDWQQVEARKTRLAAQWELAATKAVDQLNDHLDSATLPANTLVPIAGCATDTLLALRGHMQAFQVAAVVIPTAEEQAERRAIHARLDAIA